MKSEQTSTTNIAIKSLSTQTVMTIALAIVSIVSFSIMSRLLTREDFGYYATITAVTTIFNALSEAGMGAALIQKKDISNEYVDTAFSMSLYIGLFFSLLLIALSSPLASLIADSSMVTPLRLMSICVLLHSLYSVTKANMTKKLAFKKIGIYNIISEIIAISVGVTFAYYGFGVYSIIMQQICASIVLFTIFYCNLEYKPKWFKINSLSAKEIFNFGGWLTASVILRTIYQQMDKLLMGRWLSITALGSYNRPAGFINQISSRFNGILDTVLFPILSSIQDDFDKIKRAYDILIYSINLYSSIMCVMFIISNKWIISVFFGSEWGGLSTVFCILSLSLLLSVNGRIMDCFIRSLAFVKAGFYLRILACITTFICLFIGKNYGIEGVALSIIISNYIIIFTKLWYIGWKINVPFYRTLLTMIKPYRVTLVPILPFILFNTQISNSNVGSIIATLGAGIYYMVLIICFPKVAGDAIMNIVYKKMPFLKKLRVA